MRCDTRTVTIDAAPEDVLAFVADPANLPRWAIGFAKDVRHQPEGWVVSTAQGDIAISIEADARCGTVDFRMEMAPGLEVTAYSRVVPNGDGCEYTFTQFQQSGVPDEMFEQLVSAVRHELVTLKALMEVMCPL